MFDKFRDYQARKESYAQDIYNEEYYLLTKAVRNNNLWGFISMDMGYSCVPAFPDRTYNYNVMVHTIYAYYTKGHPEIADQFENALLDIIKCNEFSFYENCGCAFETIFTLNYNQKNGIAPFNFNFSELIRTFNESFEKNTDGLKIQHCPNHISCYDYIISKNAEREENGYGILTEGNKTR